MTDNWRDYGWGAKKEEYTSHSLPPVSPSLSCSSSPQSISSSVSPPSNSGSSVVTLNVGMTPSGFDPNRGVFDYAAEEKKLLDERQRKLTRSESELALKWASYKSAHREREDERRQYQIDKDEKRSALNELDEARRKLRKLEEESEKRKRELDELKDELCDLDDVKRQCERERGEKRQAISERDEVKRKLKKLQYEVDERQEQEIRKERSNLYHEQFATFGDDLKYVRSANERMMEILDREERREAQIDGCFDGDKVHGRGLSRPSIASTGCEVGVQTIEDTVCERVQSLPSIECIDASAQTEEETVRERGQSLLSIEGGTVSKRERSEYEESDDEKEEEDFQVQQIVDHKKLNKGRVYKQVSSHHTFDVQAMENMEDEKSIHGDQSATKMNGISSPLSLSFSNVVVVILIVLLSLAVAHIMMVPNQTSYRYLE